MEIQGTSLDKGYNPVTSAVRIQPDTLFRYRVFGLIFSVGCYFWELIRYDFRPQIALRFLTSWSYIFVMIYFFLVVLATLRTRSQGQEYKDSTLCKAAHMAFIIAFCYQLSVTLLFWAIIVPVHPGILIELRRGFRWEFFALQVTQHGVFFVVIWIDNLFNMFNFQRKHLVALTMVGVIYFANNYFTVLIRNREIYPYINWKNLQSCGFVLIAFGFTFIHYKIGERFFARKEQLFQERRESSLLYSSDSLSTVNLSVE